MTAKSTTLLMAYFAASILLVFGATGCTAGSRATAAPPGSRDSAGIRIIENSASAWSPGDGWLIDTVPMLDIGAAAGAPEYELSAVRAAVRLRDGRIALANMGTTQIRFYDRAGKFIKSVGRYGRGPGEFEQLWRLKKIADDSLMALEPVDITSIFTSDGRFIRRFMLDPAKGYTNIWWLGRLDGGYLVAFSLARIGTRELQPDPNRKLAANEEEGGYVVPPKPRGYRDSLMHLLYTMDGRLIDTIARLPSQPVGEQLVFAPDGAYAFEGDRFVHSPGDKIELREFRLTGGEGGRGVDSAAKSGARLRLSRIIRVTDSVDLTVTEADKQHHFDELRARYKGRLDDRQIQFQIDRIKDEFPARLPAHGNRMYADPSHYLWLQGFNSDRDAPAVWKVIDSTGRFLGAVKTPERFMLTEVGNDYALGVWRDSLDVEHVRMYGLKKPRN